MARNDKARLDCRALPYLQPVARISPSGDPAAEFLTSGSRSPARAAIEARSDLSFIDELIAQVAEQTTEDAAAATATVLSAPTVAARKALVGGEALILQSVILKRLPDEFDSRVTLQLRTIPGKPATLKIESVDVTYVDLDERDDRRDLVALVEDWWREYPMPTVKVPEPFPLRDWAWLGNPEHVGIQGVPTDWREKVTRLGAVHGVPPLIAESAGQIEAWNLTDRIEHAVLLRGAKLAGDFHAAAEGRDIEVLECSYGGSTFSEVLAHVRGQLLAEAEAASAPTPTSRDLADGEVIYHRKVGNSRKFDRFDAGTTSPCTHGAGSFTGWGGDKALKGMARRYDNFTTDMLIHCEKYPNCGMYGVDARRGGLKADGD